MIIDFDKIIIKSYTAAMNSHYGDDMMELQIILLVPKDAIIDPSYPFDLKFTKKPKIEQLEIKE